MPCMQAATLDPRSLQADVCKFVRRIADPTKARAVRQAAADELWPYTWGNDAEMKKQAIAAEDCIIALIGVLEDSSADPQLRGRVCNIFQNLACGDQLKEQLVQKGAVPPVLRLFCTVEDPGESEKGMHGYMRGPAWGALNNLMGSEVRLDYIKELARLSSSSSVHGVMRSIWPEAYHDAAVEAYHDAAVGPCASRQAHLRSRQNVINRLFGQPVDLSDHQPVVSCFSLSGFNGAV